MRAWRSPANTPSCRRSGGTRSWSWTWSKDWQEVGRIPVHGQPVFAVSRPDGRQIWVNFAHPDNDTVQVIDAATLKVVHSIQPGPAVLHLEFTPRGEQVWISVRDADRVDVYDTRSLALLGSLPADKPSGIFMTARATPDRVLSHGTGKHLRRAAASRSNAGCWTRFQRDLPLVPRPYQAMADASGCSEAEVLEALGRLHATGVLSRVGFIVRPNTAGASTLAAMSVPENELEAVAARISARPEVNHNYEREHRLNLWFVVAAEDATARQRALCGRSSRRPATRCSICRWRRPITSISDFH